MMRFGLVLIMVYVTLLRHEGLHALVAFLEGAEINAIVLLPGYDEELGFYFGYVSYGEGASWMTKFAPYIGAFLWSLLSFWIVKKNKLTGRAKLVVLFIGVISGLGDLVYGYIGGFVRASSDVSELLTMMPPVFVHGFFIAAIASTFLLMRNTHSEPGE